MQRVVAPHLISPAPVSGGREPPHTAGMRRVAAVARQLVSPAPVSGGGGVAGPAAQGDVAPGHAVASPVHQYGEVEWQLRCKLAVAYRIAAHFGWDQLVFNHITVKLPGTSKLENGPHFLINPFGLRFDEVTASSLVKADLAGNVVERGSASGLLFKQGFVVHSAVHQARPELQCVWHSHHADTTAVCMTKAGFLPLSQEAIALHGRISYHPFEGTATDLSERERMAASLGPVNRVMLLVNHGPLTAGGSIEEAFVYHYLITLACSWQIKAMSAAGGDLSRLHVPTEEELQRLHQRARDAEGRSRDEVDRKSESYDSGLTMWLAAVRMMETKHGPDIYT